MSGPIQRTPARELTVEEHLERKDLAASLDRRIKSCLRTVRHAGWEAAKLMHLFDEEEGWTALGYDSLSEWLADPEVEMSRSSFYRMVKRHREMVEIRQVPEKELAALDPSKVDLVLPAIKENAKPLAEILDDAKACGARELREMYSTPKPALPPVAEPEPEPILEPVVRPNESAAPLLSQVEAVGALNDALTNGSPDDVREAAQGLLAAVVAPTEGEWLAMQERANRRRRPLRSLALVAKWSLVGSESDRSGWQVPFTDLDRRHV